MFNRNNQQQRRRGGGRGRGGFRNTSNNRNGAFSSKQLTARASGIETPFFAQHNNAGAGLLGAFDASPVTGGDYFTINPLLMGQRLAQMADLYNEYRINYMRITYKPAQTTVNDSSATPGGTQTQQAAGGIVLDPTVGSLTQDEIVQGGGKNLNLGRPMSWVLRRTKWLYCKLVGNSTADVRFVSPGNFYFIQYQNAGDTLKFGVVEVHWDISFRFPLDPTDAARVPNSLANVTNMMEHNKQYRADRRRLVEDTKSDVSIDFVEAEVKQRESIGKLDSDQVAPAVCIRPYSKVLGTTKTPIKDQPLTGTLRRQNSLSSSS